MEDITLSSLCVFMRCLLITVAATQVSFECVVSPEITQRSPHPTIQYVDEGTEPKRGKAACPVFDSGLCRDFVVWGSITEEGLKWKSILCLPGQLNKDSSFCLKKWVFLDFSKCQFGDNLGRPPGHKHIQQLMGWFVLSWSIYYLSEPIYGRYRHDWSSWQIMTEEYSEAAWFFPGSAYEMV